MDIFMKTPLDRALIIILSLPVTSIAFFYHLTLRTKISNQIASCTSYLAFASPLYKSFSVRFSKWTKYPDASLLFLFSSFDCGSLSLSFHHSRLFHFARILHSAFDDLTWPDLLSLLDFAYTTSIFHSMNLFSKWHGNTYDDRIPPPSILRFLSCFFLYTHCLPPFLRRAFQFMYFISLISLYLSFAFAFEMSHSCIGFGPIHLVALLMTMIYDSQYLKRKKRIYI